MTLLESQIFRAKLKGHCENKKRRLSTELGACQGLVHANLALPPNDHY